MNIPFIPVIDHVNLAFHEAGHVIIGIFGNDFLMIAGGTIFQLAFPLAALLYFCKKERQLASMAMLFWFGENFRGIGTYMKDALALELPLVGGGLHDWTYLFGELGVITKCVKIGNTTIIIGFLVMAYALFDIGITLYKGRMK
jgi:hypothetical protein